MEGQDLNEVSAVDLELEEDFIPNEDEVDDSGLEDVIPCEYVAIEQQAGEAFDMAGTSDDGFYDDVGYTAPTTTTDQMVDIATHVVGSSENELEEVEIPNEYNTADDDQLDDVA